MTRGQAAAARQSATIARRAVPAGTILILGGLAAVGPLSGDMYLPAFPAIAADLDATPVSVQLTLTASLIGLGAGQLLVGPLSDLWGRRRPLLAGIVGYVLASAGCAVAPTVEVLTGLRLLQGLAGAAAVVLARAIVRDLYSGIAAARAYSQLMLVFGVAPVVAPLLGSAVLAAGHWRGIFLVLAALGVAQLAGIWLRLPESLPPDRRGGAAGLADAGDPGDAAGSAGGDRAGPAGGLRGVRRATRRVLADRVFLGYALVSGLAAAGVFAYLAGSPFVVQELYGASANTYALLFAVNAAGFGVISHVNGRLVGRLSPARLLSVGVAAHLAGASCLLGLASLAAAGVLPAKAGLPALAPAMFVVVASVGMILPNATTLAMHRFPDAAGAASSVLGASHFAIGASLAPLVGLGDGSNAIPFGVVIGSTATAAVLLRLLVGWWHR